MASLNIAKNQEGGGVATVCHDKLLGDKGTDF